ncbi:MAG: glycoside hydrolase family 16 protein [Burkholderiaceae bacterium]|nr:glycoside hydrolase family 16 protein [Burkholderiaceae bacterium]
MPIKNRSLPWLAVISATALLVGCGGGSGGASSGSSSSSSTSTPPNTASTPSQPGASTINFSGYTFEVYSGTSGPGPNTWSSQNVWVDSNGYLHLKIANNGGQWSTAQIYSDQTFSYGTFQFKIIGHPEALDKNVVLGLFTYTTPGAGPDGTNEIDIEFSTWGGQQVNAGNWTVWPAVTGIANSTQSFDARANTGLSTHRFNWTQNQIVFQALSGLVDDNTGQYATWTFAPASPSTQIPLGFFPLYMNLWLFKGLAPSNGQEVEIVISEFKFIPGS